MGNRGISPRIILLMLYTDFLKIKQTLLNRSYSNYGVVSVWECVSDTYSKHLDGWNLGSQEAGKAFIQAPELIFKVRFSFSFQALNYFPTVLLSDVIRERSQVPKGPRALRVAFYNICS